MFYHKLLFLDVGKKGASRKPFLTFLQKKMILKK